MMGYDIGGEGVGGEEGFAEGAVGAVCGVETGEDTMWKALGKFIVLVVVGEGDVLRYTGTHLIDGVEDLGCAF